MIRVVLIFIAHDEFMRLNLLVRWKGAKHTSPLQFAVPAFSLAVHVLLCYINTYITGVEVNVKTFLTKYMLHSRHHANMFTNNDSLPLYTIFLPIEGSILYF